MKTLNKEEQKVLYFIFIGRNNLERLGETFKDEEELTKMLDSLEKKGLIKISWREGKIYGVIETTAGYELVKSNNFEDWNISNN